MSASIHVEFKMSISGYFQTYIELLNFLHSINKENNNIHHFSMSIEKHVSNKLFLVHCSFDTQDYGEDSVLEYLINTWEGEDGTHSYNKKIVIITIDKTKYSYVKNNSQLSYFT